MGATTVTGPDEQGAIKHWLSSIFPAQHGTFDPLLSFAAIGLLVVGFIAI